MLLGIIAATAIGGGILGVMVGFYYGPIITFSVEQKASSWIGTICLIASSLICSNL